MDPSKFISKWYRKEIYLKTFSHYIQCVPGIKLWKEKDHPCIEPPEVKALPGRPKRNRRKPRDEPKKINSFPRRGAKTTCSHCKQQGHNKKGCQVREVDVVQPQV